MSDQQPYKILVPIYDGCNTLDVNGPLDVFCNYAIRLNGNDAANAPFNVTITAKQKTVKAYEFITLQADITFDEAIPLIKKGEYDILLVPGGGGGSTNKLASNKDQILDVISAFIEYDTARGRDDVAADEAPNKWLFSVCVGAILVGAARGFNGLNATTHWAALRDLAKFSKGAMPNSITRNRWVDGGYLPPASGQKVPTHVVSAGGISCCLDGSLWVVAQILGIGAAVSVANMMDYKWNVDLTTPPQTLWYTDPLMPDGIQQPFGEPLAPTPKPCTDRWSQWKTTSQ